MASFLKRFALFGALLTVCYLAVLFVAANSGAAVQEWFRQNTTIPVGTVEPGGSSLLRFREIEDYADVDVVFIGSSHCYRAFDPRWFGSRGLRVFNMGSTSQTPLNSYFLLGRHVDRLKPKLLVVETYWEVLQWDGLESFLDLSQNLRVTPELWRMALATKNVRAVNALLTRVLEIGRRPLDTIEPSLWEQDTYVPGGYVETDPSFRSFYKIPPRELVFSDLQERYLRKIVRLGRARGIAVVLVIQPLPRETRDAFTNLHDLVERMRSLAEDEGVRYLDFDELMDPDTRDWFFDYHHLNQRGVERFNARLYEELDALGLLPRRAAEAR